MFDAVVLHRRLGRRRVWPGPDGKQLYSTYRCRWVEGREGEGIGLRSVLATVVELHCDTYPSSHKQNYVWCVRSIAPSDYVRMHQSNVADTIWYPFMARPASPVHC